MDNIDMVGVVSVLLVLVILVAATRILHGALRTQNQMLKQQCLTMAAAVADVEKSAESFKRRAEEIETDLRVQIERANGRIEVLRDSLTQIGVDPNSLERMVGTDDYWRISALRLIVAQVDESRIDSTADEKRNAMALLTARGFICEVAA